MDWCKIAAAEGLLVASIPRNALTLSFPPIQNEPVESAYPDVLGIGNGVPVTMKKQTFLFFALGLGLLSACGTMSQPTAQSKTPLQVADCAQTLCTHERIPSSMHRQPGVFEAIGRSGGGVLK